MIALPPSSAVARLRNTQIPVSPLALRARARRLDEGILGLSDWRERRLRKRTSPRARARLSAPWGPQPPS